MAKQKPLVVKSCVVAGKKAFGITDGRVWFFYAYKTKEKCESMLSHFTEAKAREVNISQPQAFKLAE